LSDGTGTDLGVYPLDHPLTDVRTEGVQSLLDWVKASVEGRAATERDIGILPSRSNRVTGTPERIVEELRKIFGRDRLPDSHPAAAWRGAFR
jgi:hypothetical protein